MYVFFSSKCRPLRRRIKTNAYALIRRVEFAHAVIARGMRRRALYLHCIINEPAMQDAWLAR